MKSPLASVPLNELEQAEESRPLVPVGQRVVSNQVPCEYGSLLGEFRISLDTTETGGRRGERGCTERHHTIYADELLGRDVEHAFRDCEVIGEVEILEIVRYRASLSRI